MNSEITNEEKDCLFCKIIRGEIPSEKIYEDEQAFAFLDINPVNIGHTLLVPKTHSQNIFDIETETLEKIAPILKKLSLSIKKAVDADGINITSNNGGAAGQLVFHLHLHIIPRFSNDGLKHWPGKNYTGKEMSETAEKIKLNLKN
jgi:histidine triad (HIT) family protein